jgi:hypothetical protein
MVHGMIPRKLKNSFYNLYFGQYGHLFFCGAIIPTAMSIVAPVMYAVFLFMGKFIRSYSILIFIEIFAFLWISPLLVKLYVLLRKANKEN